MCAEYKSPVTQTLQKFLVVVLDYVNLMELEFHFPKFPSLYGSGLGLATREICITFGSEAARSVEVALYHCSLHTLSLICRLTLWAWAHSQLCSPSSSATSHLSASASPQPAAHAATWQRAPAFPAGRCILRAGGGEREVWIPVCPSLLLHMQFSPLLLAPVTCTYFRPIIRCGRSKPSVDFSPDPTVVEVHIPTRNSLFHVINSGSASLIGFLHNVVLGPF